MKPSAIILAPRLRIGLSLVIAVVFAALYPFLDFTVHRYQTTPDQRAVVDYYPIGGSAASVTLPGHLSNGSDWSKGTTLKEGQGVTITFSNPPAATRIRVQADGNDDYRLGIKVGPNNMSWFDVPTVEKSGLRDRIIELPREMTVEEMLLYPVWGDAAFSVSAVELANGLTSGIRFGGVAAWLAALFAAVAVLILAAASLSWIIDRLLARLRPTSEVDNYKVFARVLGALFLLSACGLGGLSLIPLITQPSSSSCDPQWYLAAIGAVVLLWSAAQLVDKAGASAECPPAESTDKVSDKLVWCGIIAYRALPFFLGLIPLGLFWEESQAAVGGRAALMGECGYLLLYTFNELGIGLAFLLFGVSEQTVHLWATLLGALSCVLFERTAALLFSRRISLFLTVLFATSLSMTVASFIAEESFAMTIFCMTGILWGLVSCLKTHRLSSFVGLGAFLGVAAMEYAALKPGIAIAPLVLLAAFFARLVGSHFSLRCLFSALVRAGTMLCSALILAAPVVVNAWHRGSAFFEGDRAVRMVGADAYSFLWSRAPTMLPSLQEHIRQFLWRGAEYPPLVGFVGRPPGLLSVCETLLFSLSLVAAPVLLLRLVFTARGAALATGCRMALWLSWSAFLVWYCAFHNELVLSHRLLVCVPLLFLFIGEVLKLAATSFAVRPRYASSAVVAGVVLLLGCNSVLLWKTLTNTVARAEYNGKTNNLCAHLNNVPAVHSYAIGYYWPAQATFFFGDTALESWQKKSMAEIAFTSYETYGNWACVVDHLVQLVQPLEHGTARILAEAAAARQASHVILIERARNLAETNPVGALSPDMLDRLRNEVGRMSSRVDASRCEYIADSSWFLSVVCPIR